MQVAVVQILDKTAEQDNLKSFNHEVVGSEGHFEWLQRKWTKRKKKVKCLRRAANCTPLNPLSIDKSPLGARRKMGSFSWWMQ